MKRTQIYLEERHAKELDRRAHEGRTTRSKLIREALDGYLGIGPSEEELLQRFREAVLKVSGVAPYLPDGATYVERERELERKKGAELEKRWHG